MVGRSVDWFDCNGRSVGRSVGLIAMVGWSVGRSVDWFDCNSWLV
ncbi:MAG: hypothetical protein ACTSU9_14790 [Promethearchaeota archaeon]